MIKPLIAALTMLLSCITIAQAQTTSPPDSVVANAAVSYALNVYTKGVGQQAEIYNGPEYNAVPRATKGSPYFLDSDNLIDGSIKYNGTWYNNTPLLYNIYKSQIISLHVVNKYRYVLHDYLLSDFIINNHHFVFVNQPDSVKQSLKQGYYELLYGGKSRILCRHTKDRVESTSVQGVEVVYNDHQNFYIQKGTDFYSVNSKGAALSFFKDKKKELDTYLKNNSIRFNDNKALALSKLAAYYDQISR